MGATHRGGGDIRVSRSLARRSSKKTVEPTLNELRGEGYKGDWILNASASGIRNRSVQASMVREVPGGEKKGRANRSGWYSYR